MEGYVYASTEFCKARLLANEAKLLPFDDLRPGKSFFMPFGIFAEGSIRSIVSNAAVERNRNFKCFKNAEEGYYEVTEVTSNIVLTFEITEASPQTKELTNNGLGGKRIYPFNTVPEGFSFIVPFGADAAKTEKTLKVACCTQSKKLNKKFFLLKHEEHGIFEVFNAPEIQVSFFKPSAEMQRKAFE